MAKHNLKEEIELMLKLVPGGWRLRFGRPNHTTRSITAKCEIVDSSSRVAVTGFGRSEKRRCTIFSASGKPDGR